MQKILLLLLAISTLTFADVKMTPHQDIPSDVMAYVASNFDTSHSLTKINNPEPLNTKIRYNSITDVKKLLQKHSNTLNPEVISTVITTIKCANKRKLLHNNILTIIDYSLPSSEKRLWIFDMRAQKLLFHTYVSHGITSGTLATTRFSNKYNSKASSLGVYTAENDYIGRHGLSLRLQGHDRSFNDNAYRRAIVLHSAWYVNDAFIKKYGRIGRSWGCPAVPKNIVKPIINTIKDDSILVIYYPSYKWLSQSQYLKCNTLTPVQLAMNAKTVPSELFDDHRDAILYVDRNNNERREENEAILVLSVDNYQRILKRKPPLKRMLRRQFNNTEYIALNHSELKTLESDPNTESDHLSLIDFVVPVVLNRGGYYKTIFKSVKSQNIKNVTFANNPQQTPLTIHYENNHSAQLRTTDHFIRWLGL